MYLRALAIRDLRAFAECGQDFERGLVVLLGANGVGKTTVLEAIHLLGHGRSFRGGEAGDWTRRGTHGFRIAARVARQGGDERLALSWDDGTSAAAWNGRACQAAELHRRLLVVTHHPDGHELADGPREARRRLIDWLLFHVEPGFLDAWRAYRRALRQRNAALRGAGAEEELAAWEPALARLGERIASWREEWLARIAPAYVTLSRSLLPELPEPELRPAPGWPASEPLARLLAARRERDRQRGHTELGPHRGGFELRWPPWTREQLSRGQAKLAALALRLAVAQVLREETSEAPIVLLDDFAAELDSRHQGLVLETLLPLAEQVWITATEQPGTLEAWSGPRQVFHVEQGRLKGPVALGAI